MLEQQIINGIAYVMVTTFRDAEAEPARSEGITLWAPARNDSGGKFLLVADGVGYWPALRRGHYVDNPRRADYFEHLFEAVEEFASRLKSQKR